ncbi:unnamed protein product [Arabis nemorensis]|uniref:Pentacotripeptide-repeat region of PRORP domain-containing protein n=1 Tax=Arabis nemorensis TaxID=586526 RepID=A0A565B6T0_9BRAS|nr:unnamed protein product [Arabis nemorensis]
MNRIGDATKVLDRLRSKGFSPDTVTYDIMIGTLCSRWKLDLAMKVFRSVVNRSLLTYTILIEATMLEGGVDEALKLLDEMLSRGLKPDMFTYNTVIRGMCKEGMVDRAFGIERL